MTKAVAAVTKERRRSRRVACELWVNWVRRGGNVEGTVGDMSERGLFVRSSQLPEAGELVRLEVYPPGQMSPLVVLAVVRSTRRLWGPSGFGVELYGMNDEQMQHWIALYRSIAAKTDQ